MILAMTENVIVCMFAEYMMINVPLKCTQIILLTIAEKEYK